MLDARFCKKYLPADTADGEVPVIMIRGDAEHIFGADGTEVYPLNINTKEIGKDIAGAVFPYYPNALFFNKWEEYYEALAAVPAKYFKNAMLDENGEASNGSGISAQAKKEMAESALRDTKKINGHYALRDYQLRYDWRLDPLYVAQQLHDYIEKVKATTGAKKVSLYGVCRRVGVIPLSEMAASFTATSLPARWKLTSRPLTAITPTRLTRQTVRVRRYLKTWMNSSESSLAQPLT